MKALPPGSRIALVAPAGPLGGAREVDRALHNAALMQWEAVVADHALARHGYFAGSDDVRLADLVSALENPAIDGIWCLRGGYGTMRLLHALEPELIARANKPLIGYSDITALHALWHRAGVVSFHGPTARAELTEFSLHHLQHVAWEARAVALHAPGATVLRSGTAHGQLVGGNLALNAALCGTGRGFDFRDAIVFFEDINEAVYRVDRMLVQLRLAGAFDGCRALVFGQFTNCAEDSGDGDYGRRSLAEVLQETADAVSVPALLGVPIGHIADQWTLAVGARATLDTAERTLSLHDRNDHERIT